jgi:hypothetical protein
VLCECTKGGAELISTAVAPGARHEEAVTSVVQRHLALLAELSRKLARGEIEVF